MFMKLWNWLDGRKAYLGGAAFILTGLGMIAADYANNKGFSHEGWTKVMEGWAIISAKSAVAKIGAVPPAPPQ